MTNENLAGEIANLSAEDLLKSVKQWIAEPRGAETPDFVKWLSDFVAAKPEFIVESDLPSLRVVLFMIARARVKASLNDVFALVNLKALQEELKADDWLMQNLHRIIGSIATVEALPQLEELAVSPDLSEDLKEQALLAIHFLWLEKDLTSDEITESYRRIIAAAMAQGKMDERMAMALALNSAVVGGMSMRSEVTSIIDAGYLGQQTDMIRKAAQAIMADNRKFREIYNSQHKGHFDDPESEIPNINKPVVEERPELKGKGTPITRATPKIGRNDPCPCGSGLKYKKCCGK